MSAVRRYVRSVSLSTALIDCKGDGLTVIRYPMATMSTIHFPLFLHSTVSSKFTLSKIIAETLEIKAEGQHSMSKIIMLKYAQDYFLLNIFIGIPPLGD